MQEKILRVTATTLTSSTKLKPKWRAPAISMCSPCARPATKFIRQRGDWKNAVSFRKAKLIHGGEELEIDWAADCAYH